MAAWELWRLLPARVRRYARLELAAWVGSLVVGGIAWGLSEHIGALAVGAVIGESLGFYCTAWLLERRSRGLAGAAAAPGPVLMRLVEEFALAEGLDVLVVRPLAIALASTIVPPPFLAIAVGGMAADVVFYCVASAGARGRSGSGAARWRVFPGAAADEGVR